MAWMSSIIVFVLLGGLIEPVLAQVAGRGALAFEILGAALVILRLHGQEVVLLDKLAEDDGLNAADVEKPVLAGARHSFQKILGLVLAEQAVELAQAPHVAMASLALEPGEILDHLDSQCLEAFF